MALRLVSPYPANGKTFHRYRMAMLQRSNNCQEVMESFTASSRLSQIRAHLDTSQLPSLAASSASDTSQSTRNESTDGPSIILLFGWTGAAPSQLARYVANYSRTYPSARVIVLDCAFPDFYPWPLRGKEELERGFDEVMEVIGAKEKERGILVHIFSNGGAIRFAYIANRFLETNHVPLPIRALVLDSAPCSMSPSTKAFTRSETLPYPWPLRYIAFIPISIALNVWNIWMYASFQREPVAWACQLLNDRKFVPREAKRAYIYSSMDRIINWKSVEDHAKVAKEKGYTTRLELFEGSSHVGHAKKDPQRYWTIVEELWQSSIL